PTCTTTCPCYFCALSLHDALPICILQPLIVKEKDDYYEIVAGERRWRAAKIAGLKEVPVILKEFNEQEIVEISLIENIQRENLKDRKSTRLNSSHVSISYAVFCLK